MQVNASTLPVNASPPRLGEQEDIDTNYEPQPEGYEHRAWCAWYRDADPDAHDGLDFGFGSTELRAVNDLLIRFPREG